MPACFIHSAALPSCRLEATFAIPRARRTELIVSSLLLATLLLLRKHLPGLIATYLVAASALLLGHAAGVLYATLACLRLPAKPGWLGEHGAHWAVTLAWLVLPASELCWSPAAGPALLLEATRALADCAIVVGGQ